jgi:O-antigen biosynthesis protein
MPLSKLESEPVPCVADQPSLWPRISLLLVRPAEPGSRFLSTIRSVENQNYPNLEILPVEAGPCPGVEGSVRDPAARAGPEASTIARLNAAFQNSSGEILGWLTAGELLHQGALASVGGIFRDLPQVEWITGIPTVFGENGEALEVKHLERWSRMRFLAGANKYIHRDTTFWRRRLWEKAGGSLAVEAGVAAEFELFTRLFRYAPLYSVEALLGGWRSHPGDYAGGRYRQYNRAADDIADAELKASPGAYAAKAFRQATRAVNRFPLVRRYWHKIVLRSLYRCPGWDWPRKIVNRGGRWQFQ